MEIDFSQKILTLGGDIYFLLHDGILTEEVITNERFADYLPPNGFNLDLLAITNPDLIADVCDRYLKAGTDIIKTCTYSASIIGQSDWLRDHPRDHNKTTDREWYQEVLEDPFIDEVVSSINRSAVATVKKQVSNAETEHLVAGTLGPLSVSLANPPTEEFPSTNHITHDQLVSNYSHQVKILIDAGVDLLLVDSVFDHLNCLAALDAIKNVCDITQTQIPVIVCAAVGHCGELMISAKPLVDFYQLIEPYGILALGFTDCSNRPETSQELLKTIAPLPVPIFYHPELSFDDGSYQRRHATPVEFSEAASKLAQDGLFNIIGGAFYATPDHIKHLNQAMRDTPHRPFGL